MGNARYQLEISNDPTEQLPFEIQPKPEKGRADWTFAPEYYPDRFPQSKDKELDRSGKQCGGEDVTIESIKNREFHINGVILARKVPQFNMLLDFDGVVDLYSPVSPSGGMECYVKTGEIDAKPEGFDGIHRMWRFEYSIDLVSTGEDEYDRTTNSIVSAIVHTGGGGAAGGMVQ